jgi:glycerate kinase
MIEIRWHKETNEIDLGGTPQDLQYVRQSILSLIQADETQISISVAADFNPALYSGRLSSLIIRKSKGATKVSIVTNQLEIEGNSEKLEAFADWFDFEADVSHYHYHFEYYPGDTWVDPDSLPLVISVRS